MTEQPNTSRGRGLAKVRKFKPNGGKYGPRNSQKTNRAPDKEVTKKTQTEGVLIWGGIERRRPGIRRKEVFYLTKVASDVWWGAMNGISTRLWLNRGGIKEHRPRVK